MSKKSAFDTAHQQGSMGSKIVVALERISEAFRVLLWNEGKAEGLSPLQVQLLIFLLHHPEGDKRKVGHLAAEFNMTKADQRSFSLALSPEGETLARRASHFSSEIQTPIERLSENDQANLLLHLLGIIKHLNRAGVITVQRMCYNCAHYRIQGNGHFCQLMNTPLQASELRVDCPEHEVVG
jgi:DNA-binding transcriptional ArsR family regulator